MQTLTVIIPFSRTTSNFALSCKSLRDWLSNNCFPIQTGREGLGLENLSFYKSLNYPGVDKWTMYEMFKAIQGRNPDYLWSLVQKGDIEERYNDFTALMWTAELGEIKCLKMLIEQKADIDAKDKYGHTPLMLATIHGHTDCLRFLLGYKADPRSKDINKKTALHLAAMNGKPKCINLLLQYKADLGAQDKDGNTALDTASRSRQTECLALLLQHKARI